MTQKQTCEECKQLKPIHSQMSSGKRLDEGKIIYFCSKFCLKKYWGRQL